MNGRTDRYVDYSTYKNSLKCISVRLYKYVLGHKLNNILVKYLAGMWSAIVGMQRLAELAYNWATHIRSLRVALCRYGHMSCSLCTSIYLFWVIEYLLYHFDFDFIFIFVVVVFVYVQCLNNLQQIAKVKLVCWILCVFRHYKPSLSSLIKLSRYTHTSAVICSHPL